MAYSKVWPEGWKDNEEGGTYIDAAGLNKMEQGIIDAHTHIANTSNPHSVTKDQVGLGDVPNVTTNDQTPTYTAASALAALTSGEKISTAFGKIAKGISDLISHIANTTLHITGEERDAWNAKQSALTFDSTPTLDSANPVTSNGVKAALNTLESNIKALDEIAKDAYLAAATNVFDDYHAHREFREYGALAEGNTTEVHIVTLTNSSGWPYNSTVDVPVSVALNTPRNTVYYTVTPEVVSHTGNVGDIYITDKAVNGFKVHFDGSGSSVTLNLIVQGGYTS